MAQSEYVFHRVEDQPELERLRLIERVFDPASRKVNRAIKVIYDKLGMDYALGQRVESLLQDRRLQSVAMENDGAPAPGGSGLATIMKLSTVQLREKYLATGVVTEEDLCLYCRFAERPQSSAVYYATIAVSGRKPL